MQYWFSSDYHFYHDKIRFYENRPFQSIEEMNETIIKRHNERVKKDDIVFFLGDIGFYASSERAFRGEGMPMRAMDLLSLMNGSFTRVLGNHDTKANKAYTPVHSINLSISGLRAQLIHNPDQANLNNNLIICGHCHSKFKTKEIMNDKGIPVLIINVAVENNNYRPFNWDELKAMWDLWVKNHPKRKIILSNLFQPKRLVYKKKE